KLNPNDDDGHKLMGAIFIRQNQPNFSKALFHLSKAFKNLPNDSFILVHLARAYSLVHDYTTALEYVNAILNLNSLHLEGLLIRASILIQQNRLSQANKDLEKISISNRTAEWQQLSKLIAERREQQNSTTKCSCVIL